MTSTDASNPSAILFIATSHGHAALLLHGVFVIGAIMPQPIPSGKPHLERQFPTFRLTECRAA
jgi:hypothetical protein